jgi:hypothetical protein
VGEAGSVPKDASGLFNPIAIAAYERSQRSLQDKAQVHRQRNASPNPSSNTLGGGEAQDSSAISSTWKHNSSLTALTDFMTRRRWGLDYDEDSIRGLIRNVMPRSAAY